MRSGLLQNPKLGRADMLSADGMDVKEMPQESQTHPWKVCPGFQADFRSFQNFGSLYDLVPYFTMTGR